MLASKEAKFLKMQLPPVTEALMQCSGLRSMHFYLAKVQPSHLKPCIFLSDANCTLIFLVRCLPERLHEAEMDECRTVCSYKVCAVLTGIITEVL